ncbi:MAG: hypothetical protein GXY74_05675 [Phycisphaerae bacterium]|nr:hypothetical protein [Phycisphaerae bacterium]
MDISSMLEWGNGLPQPNWDLANAWVASGCGDDPKGAWTEFAKAWLWEVADALGSEYAVGESSGFVMLCGGPAAADASLLGKAESYRRDLLVGLGDVVRFIGPGKQLVMAFHRAEDYGRYVRECFGEGEEDCMSAGMHLRDDYPRIVLWGDTVEAMGRTLAHELTHAGLYHAMMPRWLEEGLALVAGRAASGELLRISHETASLHRAFWSETGLDAFWNGGGFSGNSRARGMCYELAHILVQPLVEDHRPRWFGLSRRHHRAFMAFLREAAEFDGGDSACIEHLGLSLGDLAARFLGPGNWSREP